MQDISKIDKNFAVEKVSDDGETEFYNVLSEPFKVYGLRFPDEVYDGFYRIDHEVAKNTSSGVEGLYRHTAGGRVRFKTDSPYIDVDVVYGAISKMSHITLLGCGGFDLYVREDDGEWRFLAPFSMAYSVSSANCSRVNTNRVGLHEYLIHFPLYASVKSVKIGLKAGSVLEKGEDYKYPVPVVYYGSSITQGGCASRAGMAYQNMLSRWFDCDHINLGFSGNAKGEDAIAEYMATLPMSVFVLDYDHNAPTAEHLKNTHSKVFKAVRATHPDIPIVMMTRPKGVLSKDEENRRDIIKATYDEAKANGDNNVWFLDMSLAMKFRGGNEGTVDNCHPTDLGFFRMAEAVAKVFEEIFE